MTLDQWIIALTGGASAWLVHDKRKTWRLWACIFALIGQPFWFYAAWKAQQWGIFTIDLVFTLGWLKGFWSNWK